jgi:hypothetical protein
MGHKRNILMVAALAVLVVLLMGCSQSSIRLGWVETSSPGHLNASYGEFTGTETRTVLAQSGETLYLEYDAEVDNGSLHLESMTPTGRLSGASPFATTAGRPRRYW